MPRGLHEAIYRLVYLVHHVFTIKRDETSGLNHEDVFIQLPFRKSIMT